MSKNDCIKMDESCIEMKWKDNNVNEIEVVYIEDV